MTTSILAPNQTVLTSGLPRLSANLALTVLLAGALATAAFDLFGQAIAPMLGLAKLAPIPLANATWKVAFGEAYRPGAHLLHYLAGLIAYPAGWALFWRPLQTRFVPQLHWFASATLYGIGLWVFALYIMAHLIVGNAAFLGFSQITWVALFGHILFAWVTAASIAASDRQA